MPDVLFILVLALVIFGPAKLPHLARELAKYRAQFKQMQRALMQQVEAEISNIQSQAPPTIASGAGHENVPAIPHPDASAPCSQSPIRPAES